VNTAGFLAGSGREKWTLVAAQRRGLLEIWRSRSSQSTACRREDPRQDLNQRGPLEIPFTEAPPFDRYAADGKSRSFECRSVRDLQFFRPFLE
jgi:hypothetical protein